MPTAPNSVDPPSTASVNGDTKVVESSARAISPVTTSPPSTYPVVGSSLSRAQTFPFNFRGIRSKSPRPAPGPVQVQRPADSEQIPLSKAAKQSQRAASEPTVLRSPPSSPTRPSLTSPSVSSTSHYGRHANEWLFGNFSLRKTVKGVWKGHEGKEK